MRRASSQRGVGRMRAGFGDPVGERRRPRSRGPSALAARRLLPIHHLPRTPSPCSPCCSTHAQHCAWQSTTLPVLALLLVASLLATLPLFVRRQRQVASTLHRAFTVRRVSSLHCSAALHRSFASRCLCGYIPPCLYRTLHGALPLRSALPCCHRRSVMAATPDSTLPAPNKRKSRGQRQDTAPPRHAAASRPRAGPHTALPPLGAVSAWATEPAPLPCVARLLRHASAAASTTHAPVT
jgi:hypothetical protein